MKLRLYFIAACICSCLNGYTQTNYAGEYYLQNVPETACGFKLNADSSFAFFFTYGALDRYGSGRWAIEKDSIILNSKPYAGSDFKLSKTSATNNTFSVIQLEDNNTNLYRYVYCRVNDSVYSFDDDGTLALPVNANSVELLCEFCPERISTFVLNNPPAIYTFNFEPWIFEVFFNKDTFYISNEYMEGKHAMLGDEINRFSKEANTPGE
jgi:hypothetical protein